MARDEAVNIHMAVDRRSHPLGANGQTPGALGSIGRPGAAVMAQAQTLQLLFLPPALPWSGRPTHSPGLNNRHAPPWRLGPRPRCGQAAHWEGGASPGNLQASSPLCPLLSPLTSPPRVSASDLPV